MADAAVAIDHRALFEELRESEGRFRHMADSAPVLLWMAGTDSQCDFFNQQWLSFTGKSLEAERGTGWAEGVHPEDLQHCMHTYLEAFVARKAFRMEYRLRRADGEYRWLLDQGVPRYLPSGAFAGYIGSCVDVTELREATEAQRRATAQLEVLFQEIHHRVKNNLQLITSLLSLQAKQLGDGDAAAVLRDMQARVRSLALLHEHLYHSPDLASIGVDEYLVGVIAALRSALGALAPAARLSLSAPGVVVDIDTAIPCGLIVTELVTNAYKHAFRSAGPHEPSVDVRVSALADERLELVVADNGAGFREEVDLVRPTTLGMRLVVALTRQLAGEVVLSRTDGTRWTLTFPPTAKGRAAHAH